MMTKKALVAASFGTTCPTARRAIEKIEERLARELPKFDCFRAFTSTMIIKKLRREQNLDIPTPGELMERLVEQGYQEIVCQPLHVLNGLEYEKLCRQILPFQDKLASLKIGKPLLTVLQDYADCCDLIARNAPSLGKRDALVLMGHGTDHFSNAAYCQLEDTLHDRDMDHVMIGTVQGFPNLDAVIKKLRRNQVEKTVLMPFMIVAGDHAQNDLAGDGEESWKSVLRRMGYHVDVVMKGLGDFPETGDIFVRHLKEALTS